MAGRVSVKGWPSMLMQSQFGISLMAILRLIGRPETLLLGQCYTPVLPCCTVPPKPVAWQNMR